MKGFDHQGGNQVVAAPSTIIVDESATSSETRKVQRTTMKLHSMMTNSMRSQH